MSKNILVAPSILSADFSKLSDEIKKVEDSGADLIHIDVMDGHFVPNITVGPLIVGFVKKLTSLPLDVHLMIEAPHRFIRQFAEAGSDIITVHAEEYLLLDGRETTDDGRWMTELKRGMSKSTDKINEMRVKEVLKEIKSFGKKAGVSLNPDSPFCLQGVLKEVDMILIMSVHPGFGSQSFIESVLSKIREARNVFSGDIEVDGGINDKNVKLVIEAGANVIVAGSYFFGAKDSKSAVRKLRGGQG